MVVSRLWLQEGEAACSDLCTPWDRDGTGNGPCISHLNPALLGVPNASNGPCEYVEISVLWKPCDSSHQSLISLSKGEFHERENNGQLTTFYSLTSQLH